MNICLIFFLLSFKKCNKLDEYIYIYFFIIPNLKYTFKQLFL